MTDHVIAQQVRSLLGNVMDDWDSVTVEVEGGVVYLEGIALNSVERDRIGQAVLRMPGVRQVVNCLATERLAHLHPDQNAIVTSKYVRRS